MKRLKPLPSKYPILTNMFHRLLLGNANPEVQWRWPPDAARMEAMAARLNVKIALPEDDPNWADSLWSAIKKERAKEREAQRSAKAKP